MQADKPERHKDGSGHHHPMGVFPIEEQVEHLAIAPSRYFPFAFSPPKRGIKSVCDASQSFSMESSVCLPCDVPQKWFGWRRHRLKPHLAHGLVETGQDVTIIAFAEP